MSINFQVSGKDPSQHLTLSSLGLLERKLFHKKIMHSFGCGIMAWAIHEVIAP